MASCTHPLTLVRHRLVAEHETLNFLTWTQYEKLFNRQLRFVHSLNGAFYYVDLAGGEITEAQVAQLSDAVKGILESDQEIEFLELPRKELIAKFQGNHDDKVEVLKFWPSQTVKCIKCGDAIDYVYQPHSTDKARLRLFEMRVFDQGFVVRFPTLVSPDAIPEWKDPVVLRKVIDEYEETKRICKIETVGQLNKMIYEKRMDEVKNIAEGIHEKRLKDLADSICRNFGEKRIITIAGGSSSNKTTFALKLGMALRVNGFDALVMGMDDYFLDEKDIPYDEKGEQDWEAVTVLNLPLIGERIGALMRGEVIPRRRFNWDTGVSYDDPKETQSLNPHGFLIMEGIHGMNPALLEILGKDRVTPIYLQSTSPINIDNTHRFPSSDLRLLRRLIRDYKFRAYPPRPMFQRWTSVRIGEMNNIFPFQENAEYFFNSASVYEVSVLAAFGRGLCCESTMLMSDETESEESDAVTNEVYLMMAKLQFFNAVSLHIVPKTSCIREFLGGSDLKY